MTTSSLSALPKRVQSRLLLVLPEMNSKVRIALRSLERREAYATEEHVAIPLNRQGGSTTRIRGVRVYGKEDHAQHLRRDIFSVEGKRKNSRELDQLRLSGNVPTLGR